MSVFAVREREMRWCVQAVSGGPQSDEGDVVREVGGGDSTCCAQCRLATGANLQRLLPAGCPGVPLVSRGAWLHNDVLPVSPSEALEQLQVELRLWPEVSLGHPSCILPALFEGLLASQVGKPLLLGG